MIHLAMWLVSACIVIFFAVIALNLTIALLKGAWWCLRQVPSEVYWIVGCVLVTLCYEIEINPHTKPAAAQAMPVAHNTGLSTADFNNRFLFVLKGTQR